MDNFCIDITGEGFETFKMAFLLVGAQTKKTVTGYRNCPGRGLILYWVNNENSKELPYEMNMDQAACFVWGWMQNTNCYEKAPDIDGDCKKGWRIFNEKWGHISGEWQAFLAIRPEWSLYGK